MNRHVDTFRRHKIILILPVVLALLVSGWYAVSRPHKYESTMTLWFDSSAPNPSTLDNPQPSWNSAAQNGEAILQELVGTRAFLVKVGHRGPLAGYLAGRGSPNTPLVNDKIVSTLIHAFSFSVGGPQVVVVTMSAPDPVYMQGTLDSLAGEYSAESANIRSSRDAASASYYEEQLSGAIKSVQSANTAVTSYLTAHPSALPSTDPTYGALVSAASEAQQNYSTIEQQVQQAKLSLQNASSTGSFHVVDRAIAPYRLSSKKKVIFTVLAGLLSGVVISLLALSALTAADKMARRPEDIDGISGLEVVASVRQLPRHRRRAIARGASL